MILPVSFAFAGPSAYGTQSIFSLNPRARLFGGSSAFERAKKQIEKFYGNEPKNSPDFGRIINSRHAQRLADLLSGGKVIFGGEVDTSGCYISPTMLTDVDFDSSLMKDEIFGPLMPIVSVDSIDQAIDFVNDREKPLALYVFTSNYPLAEKVFTLTSSGGGCVNEVVMHNTCPSLKFGGVGESGMGGYNGRHSFESFSHEKGVLVKGLNADLSLRFPPFTKEKIDKLQWIVSVAQKLPGKKGVLRIVGGLAFVVVVSVFYFNSNLFRR